jgi:hypothetical protein
MNDADGPIDAVHALLRASRFDEAGRLLVDMLRSAPGRHHAHVLFCK